MQEIMKSICTLLNHEEYKVAIRKAGKYKFQKSYRFEMHKHQEYEINYINVGCCVMKIHNEYVPLKAGDCIIINPYVRHSFMVDMSNACCITQLEYSVTVPKELEGKIPVLDQTGIYTKVVSCENLCKALENVSRIFREQTEENEYTSAQLELALAQMYVVFSEQYIKMKEEEDSELHVVVGKVIRYINDHIEEELNVEEISRKYHVSDRYIRKYCNKYLGMNCTTYITMLRIAKAKELLWNSSKSITDIAMQTGFSSSQYFSRVFRKYAGMTPADYREMWRGKIADEF